MPATQQPKPDVERDRERRTKLNALVGEHVLHALGEPGDRSKVQVRFLWDNYYRINVIIEDEVGAISIPHSYFVEADGAGAVVTSNPKITRQY